jgi:hypothetical protein
MMMPITKQQQHSMWTMYRQRLLAIGGPHVVIKGGSVSPGQRQMLRERLRLKADAVCAEADAEFAARAPERAKRKIAAEWDNVIARIHGR